MTELQWLECSDPELMLETLRYRASDRKLRLLAIAWASRVDSWLSSQHIRDEIDLAMRFADGLATSDDMDLARMNNRSRWNPVLYPTAFEAASLVLRDAPLLQCSSIFDQQAAFDAAWNEFSIAEANTQCCILRDLFPRPCSITGIDATPPKWLSGCIPNLSQQIYSEYVIDTEAMKLLAEAIEEADCTDNIIIDHCRSAQTHFRGCWVIDLLLAKQ